MSGCDQELCSYWTGEGCACAVFGIERPQTTDTGGHGAAGEPRTGLVTPHETPARVGVPELAGVAESQERASNGTYEHDRELARKFIDAIIAERHRAHEKHGDTSMEQEELLSPWRAAILTEEAAECGTALNDWRHGDIELHDTIKSTTPGVVKTFHDGAVLDELDKELVQTAAMAYTWWANRRGDRIAVTQPSPETFVLAANQMLVRINGTPYVGEVDFADGCIDVLIKAEAAR